MFLEKIVDELLLVKNIDIKNKFGTKTHKFFYKYIKNTKNLKDAIYCRHLASLKMIATILDVPVKFVIAILKYEGVVEFDKTIKKDRT